MPDAPSQHEDPASRPTPERSVAESVPAAMLLAAVGGYLDAFLYVAHGRVFAGAMTGNTVLFGISLVEGRPHEVLHHLIPILAFICGVWLAELLQARVTRHAVAIGLGCEVAGLLAASFLPGHFPDHLFVFWIALVAAFQIASFRKAGRYSYNSTFITGDLRTAIIGLYEALDPAKRKQGLDQAGELGLLFLLFLAGALVGGLLTRHFANYALWLPVVLLAILLGITLRQRDAS